MVAVCLIRKHVSIPITGAHGLFHNGISRWGRFRRAGPFIAVKLFSRDIFKDVTSNRREEPSHSAHWRRPGAVVDQS